MNYDDYKREQIVRANSKWGRKSRANRLFKMRLREACERIIPQVGNPQKICCMGIRSGTEVFEFKEFYWPKAAVYGVDITDKIKTIKTHLDVGIELQDFNHLPEEWESRFDLVFSNSLDHAYKVEDTIAEWRRVTKPGGFLFLEFSTAGPTNIEHSFTKADLALFSDFKAIDVWDSPGSDVFYGLFQVVK